jgi:hypothetical protein
MKRLSYTQFKLCETQWYIFKILKHRDTQRYTEIHREKGINTENRKETLIIYKPLNYNFINQGFTITIYFDRELLLLKRFRSISVVQN